LSSYRRFVVVSATAACALLALSAPALAAGKLIATVGPRSTISLNRPSGQRVTRLPAGTYTLVVRDRSATHNFHLSGTPTTQWRTGAAFIDTRSWRLRLTGGIVYRYVSDADQSAVRGSFRVT
jgi:hypothetical protein